jgi:hypothetical protein
MSADFTIPAVAIMDCGTRHRLFWITYGREGQLLRLDGQVHDVPNYLRLWNRDRCRARQVANPQREEGRDAGR